MWHLRCGPSHAIGRAGVQHDADISSVRRSHYFIGPLTTSSVARHTPTALACADCCSLDENDIGDDGARLLGAWLEAGPAVSSLFLCSCGITAAGLVSLLPGLKACLDLSHLALCANPIGDAGAGILAAWVAACPPLTALSLGSCHITADGLKKLLPALQTCPSLIHLALYSNPIGDEGAAMLAAWLASGPPLVALGIGGCDITQVGDAALARAVSVNCFLDELDSPGPMAAAVMQQSNGTARRDSFIAMLADLPCNHRTACGATPLLQLACALLEEPPDRVVTIAAACRRMLARGHRPGTRDQGGNTPLHVAAQAEIGGCPALCEALLTRQKP
eukprot:m.134326 g.134326  ORF g.134326 m.134326 type:complete len:334 (-) comp9516_c0_seq4:182-1183(-)